VTVHCWGDGGGDDWLLARLNRHLLVPGTTVLCWCHKCCMPVACQYCPDWFSDGFLQNSLNLLRLVEVNRMMHSVNEQKN
jgi:hypothetical protein